MYVSSLTANAATGTLVTNVATALWTAGVGGDRIFVKAIQITNATVAPVTCLITDGTGGDYKLVVPAAACIVPYIDDVDYKLKQITITFDAPYLVTKAALYATCSAVNGCTVVVYTATG